MFGHCCPHSYLQRKERFIVPARLLVWLSPKKLARGPDQILGDKLPLLSIFLCPPNLKLIEIQIKLKFSKHFHIFFNKGKYAQISWPKKGWNELFINPTCNCFLKLLEMVHYSNGFRWEEEKNHFPFIYFF